MHPVNNDKVKIDLTAAAFMQIQLLQDVDPTYFEHCFRLKIGGKGCDGFQYDMGFSKPHQDDIHLSYQLELKHELKTVEILIDPFTAYYCDQGTLDYLINPNTNEDGFIFINEREASFHGKFFKDESMVPK